MLDIGDPVPLGVEVKDATGVLADPTALAVTVELPDGTSVAGAWTGGVSTGVVNIVRSVAGSFSAAYVAALAGLHRVRWTATGANASSYTDVFTVADTLAAVVNLAELRKHLRKTSTASDEDVRRYGLVATELAEEWLGSAIRRQTVVEEHDGGTDALLLLRMPVLSVTSVVADGATLPGTDYRLDGAAGILHHASSYFPGDLLDVVVTYVAGPRRGVARYGQAVLEIARHLWDTQRGGSQLPRQQGAGDEWVSESGWSVPRRVMELLGRKAPGFA